MDFMGKPMIVWTIQAALQSEIFERVLVSTDNEEIAAISKDYGASVPFLRKTACDDYSPVSSATCAALQQCGNELDEVYDVVVQLMPNTPLRTSEDITTATNHFIHSSAPSLISCFRFGWMNPWWAVKLGRGGKGLPVFPEEQGKRSQDLPALYCPTGAIWIADVENLLKHRTFYCPDHIFYPIPWQSAVDIDDLDDLAMAKAIFLLRKEKC